MQLLRFLCTLSAFAVPALATSDWDPNTKVYPTARRSSQADTFKSASKGEISVANPYDWLEQLDSEETTAFYTSQTAFTQQYLQQCKDYPTLQKELTNTLAYLKMRPAIPVGSSIKDTLFYYRINNGLDTGYTWYKATIEQLGAAEQNHFATFPGEKFFDENLLGPEGSYSLADDATYFSPLGKYMAYGVQYAGSDVTSIYFRETSKPFITASDDAQENAKGGPDRLSDALINVRLTDFTWTNDEKGGLYTRFPDYGTSSDETDQSPAVNGAIYYHTLGTETKDDILIVPADEKVDSSNYAPLISDDGNFLILTNFLGTSDASCVYIAPLTNQALTADIKWLSVSTNFSYSLLYLTNIGNDFYWVTDNGASNRKVVHTRIDPSTAVKVGHVTDLLNDLPLNDVIPEDQEAYIDDALVADKDKLLLLKIKDVKHELFQYELKTGKLVKRLLSDFVGQMPEWTASTSSDQVFVSAQSFALPNSIYRIGFSDQGEAPRSEPTPHKHFTTPFKAIDLSKLVTKQVFVPSKDGKVKIPMYIVYRSDTVFDGSAPAAYLRFYGAYREPNLPFWDPNMAYWISKYGGIFMLANVRGGGEYGDSWWQAGRLLNKKNTFMDIIACAEYAVEHKYVAKGKIAARGRSAGGLAALAVLNMAPEGLFGVVLADVGVSDMLRFDLFSVGKVNVIEFGDPHDPVDFDYLYSYSPYHNVNASKVYPMLLCTTADHDDRVHPSHSYKMVAEVQHLLPKNPNPLLLRVDTNSGHALTSSIAQIAEENAQKFAMIARHLGIERNV